MEENTELPRTCSRRHFSCQCNDGSATHKHVYSIKDTHFNVVSLTQYITEKINRNNKLLYLQGLRMI